MTPLVLVHGGAGAMRSMKGERAAAYRAGLHEAARLGREVLEGGGGALDAVIAATKHMEACGAFNAGRGSCLDEEGGFSLDAALMRGSDRAAGAVGATRVPLHPIEVCRDLLDEGRHVLLVGEGADRRARALGAEALGEPTADKLATYERLVAKRDAKAQGALELADMTTVGRPDDEEEAGRPDDQESADSALHTSPEGAAPGGPSSKDEALDDSHDTVGAVAVDAQGELAAAVSTGGLWLKSLGRVGDAALVGSGLFACKELGAAAVSTGIGERMIRDVTCHRACQLAQDTGAHAAAYAAVDELETRFGKQSGGVIVVDLQGNAGAAFNTDGMGRALARVGEEGIAVAVWPEDPFVA